MPEGRFAPNQNQVPDKKFKYLLLLAAGLLLVSVGSGLTYWYFTRQAPPADVQPPPTSLPTSVPETTPVAEGKVFYSEDENIFSYDTETQEVEKWTNYPQDDLPASTGVSDIKVIDENTLGFGRCSGASGYRDCGLYLLDLKTGEVTQKLELDETYHLSRSCWFSKDKLAYLVTTDDKWRLYLTDGSSTRLLVDLENTPYGRGGFVEDSSKLEFSPDGSRLFHISTGSPRAIVDLTTHIYNASTGEELAVIENSTQPDWLDDQRIVFRRYDADASSENGLYVYIVGSGRETKFSGVTETAYRPEVLPGTDQVLYEDNPEKQLWLYDVSSKESTLVVENALSGFWLSPTQVVYSNVTSCGGECGMVDYEVESIDIYDLSLGQKAGSIPGLQDTYGISSLYR